MSVAIGRSPFDIPEIYVNGVMGGAHCSTFVSDLLHHTNIIYAADIDKLLFRNTLHRARSSVRIRRILFCWEDTIAWKYVPGIKAFHFGRAPVIYGNWMI